MSMPGFDSIGRPVVGQIGTGTAATLVPVISDVTQVQPQLRGTSDAQYRAALAASGVFRDVFFDIPFQPSWFEALSEPVRTKPRSPAALSPFAFWQPAPSPFVATGWYANLSEPVRVKLALRTSLQQFAAYQANPTTVTPFAWFAPLADPVRIKLGLKAGLQQFLAADTTPIPVTKLIGWFGNLSDPVRIKPGLRAALQQFLAHPPQLRPTPTSFAAMNALETPDVFLGGVTFWNRIDTGEAGVVIITAPGSEAGVAPANTASPIASASVSIVIV